MGSLFLYEASRVRLRNEILTVVAISSTGLLMVTVRSLVMDPFGRFRMVPV